MNLTQALLDNLKVRQALGLGALDKDEQLKLRNLLASFSSGTVDRLVLKIVPDNLSQPAYELLVKMMAVLGLTEEDIARYRQSTQGVVTIHILENELNFSQSQDQYSVWHPNVLLKKPALKRQAFEQLKIIKNRL